MPKTKPVAKKESWFGLTPAQWKMLREIESGPKEFTGRRYSPLRALERHALLRVTKSWTEGGYGGVSIRWMLRVKITPKGRSLLRDAARIQNNAIDDMSLETCDD